MALSPLSASAVNSKTASGTISQSSLKPPATEQTSKVSTDLNLDTIPIYGDANYDVEHLSSPFTENILDDASLVIHEDTTTENMVQQTTKVGPLSSPNKQLLFEYQSQNSSSTLESYTSSAQSPTRSVRKASVHSSSYTEIRQSSRSVSSEQIETAMSQDRNVEVIDESVMDMADATFLTAEPEHEAPVEIGNEVDGFDDTCFSAFSEVPNADMTKFANLRHEASQQLSRESLYLDEATPRNHPRYTLPSTSSPTPAHSSQPASENDTTNLLLDFTQQFEALSTVTQRLRAVSRRSMSPAKTSNTITSSEPHLRSYLNSQRSPRKVAAAAPSTPSSKNLLTLLDFELPPAPTPRSMPTITIREMESLKSTYASQISALKATLSGRGAEVEALKRAISDAERRVGESAEQLREEKNKRECAEREKDAWERRGTEFEDVLKRVKKEDIESENEKSAVQAQAEQAETRARELESRLADMEEELTRARRENVDASVLLACDQQNAPAGAALFTAEQVQKQIDEKVHALSTELHAIYKKKHITKVAGLKKGFEAKTQEKTIELEAKIEKLERVNDDLQSKLDGTLSGVIPGVLSAAGIDDFSTSEQQRESDLKMIEEQKVIIERQKAELAGREEEVNAQRKEYASVTADLERERVEKSELVAAVDEMLALQADVSVVLHADATMKSSGMAATHVADDLLKRSSSNANPSSARPSGLARPGFGFAGGQNNKAGSKSRMMSNIERMAAGRGTD